MAKLYFSYAAMNAGKSTLLLQAAYNYRERGMEVLLLTSALYRDAGDRQISSRIGIGADATLYTQDTDLFSLIQDRTGQGRLDAIFVDEAQFLTKAQVWQLARAADHLGMPVLAYGLRTDFRGELFEGSAALLAIADNLREVRTICACGRKATMVVRLGPDGKALTEGDQISIEKTTYLSLCRRHWEERMGRFPPV
ncbi:MAG: thymidine kinase [Hyphomonas sp.]|uniref:thymidine kinase n=1 Tax=Hyphomonas sp. TaxID=87 RepID=UPI00185AEAC0|nr:thymidine kinase [Hyphomonas sp.]MBU3920266.1 thymidine kinase [Alphaproteobacteria bacterium]MBA3070337.1 thymidine kinase [Hyphomonas sp.]MBU4062824.1 thymidine kinase [Alphaproteobacteria bacterium]MBU4163743.1 thymidine kinase [Alphaproteobacteria bacterium]MBU4569659.1 thymidine kinase [Alphaproteobacteria bacterium]